MTETIIKIRKIKVITLVIMLVLLSANSLISQVNNASPSNWIFPNGNYQATRHSVYPTLPQPLDSFIIKSYISELRGDIQPLVGNIIDNEKIDAKFNYAQNEIAALVGGRPVIIDGRGYVHSNAGSIPFMKGISVLFDTTAAKPIDIVKPLVMGLESIEFENRQDSLVYTYYAGYDSKGDSVIIVKRMAVRLNNYKPNLFASIKPVLGGRGSDGNIFVFASVNMTNPVTSDSLRPSIPFLRGLFRFNNQVLLPLFPLPDMGDDTVNRYLVAPEINRTQPSLDLSINDYYKFLLPVFPSAPSVNASVLNKVNNSTTFMNKPYLLAPLVNVGYVSDRFVNKDLSAVVNGKRPEIKPYFINLKSAMPDTSLVLVSEEYKGRDSSFGTAMLHLYNADGIAITNPANAVNPSFSGSGSHQWSIATGNVDGISDNAVLPYYPNNPGDEIIVTQSSKDFVVPGSKLYIMRYNPGANVPKPSPPNSFLFPFDTITSMRINGWVAAVTDLDLAPDRKDEILLVDNSILTILRLRDYKDFKYMGRELDTVKTYNFNKETISGVAIADLEGDGKNDIIVTTSAGTYIIGSPISKVLAVTEPVSPANPSICAGDTLIIKWSNIVNTGKSVNISFVPEGQTTPVRIADNYKNISKSNTYTYIADKPLLGQKGRFFVQLNDYPVTNIDSTSIITIGQPLLSVQQPSQLIYQVGDPITLTGTSECVDSIFLEYSYDNKTWIKEVATLSGGDNFTVSFIAPCLQIYDCMGLRPDSAITLHIIGKGFKYCDTTTIGNIHIIAASFPVEVVQEPPLSTTRNFKWSWNNALNLCDTLTIAGSIDNGTTFFEIARVATKDEYFSWQPNLTLPDTILIRFCCENYCFRTDMVLSNYKVKYIDIVAPNPFNPEIEQVEIIYKAPAETNVTIRILDESNRIVSEPVKNKPVRPDYAYSDFWDGRNSEGKICSNGMYYISVEFSNGMKEIYPVFVKR